ncbi:segregation/condensation protein A [Patescibacteria group bacterium]|nr:segregation/condensation protein A [Patescibacteria group bacterium]
MHKIQLEQFEGPLDLLLKLIEKNKLQITEISLAKLTDQYLSYIENTDNLASTEVADFLLIASKLIYLKSKYLLPDLDVEDEQGAGDLEKQLKIYRQYYEASLAINKMFLSKKKFAYHRMASYKLPQDQGFSPPQNADPYSMKEVFLLVLSKIERVVNLPKMVIARAISIGEKISHIQEMIKSNTKFNFKKLLQKNDKTEIVVSFLALLELVKRKEINVDQEALFGDLNISKNNK